MTTSWTSPPSSSADPLAPEGTLVWRPGPPRPGDPEPPWPPVLVAEDTGATLQMLSRPHNHKAELKPVGTYFFLLANTRNAIRDGTPVTIVVDDVRLEHVVARS